jgi:hypothetical protein
LNNWTYGLALVAVTLAIHVASVTFMVSVVHVTRLRVKSWNLPLPHVFGIVVGSITAMGLLLAALHVMEAALWAAMATRGASGITLLPHWQILGAIEAADGMLLFGISTAFTFTVMQFYYQDLVFPVLPGVAGKPE